jgi:hypothetical protein
MSFGKQLCLILSLPFLPFIFLYEFATTYDRGEYDPKAAAQARADGIAKSYAVVYAERNAAANLNLATTNDK